ncbi:type IX secretion system protein PorG [Confluentibacter flavum]|uniref:DUF6089 domain-containing protein n=1 Tax=Confluentibacter flavum TaxID=1909700 RepID=A0A2N3HFI3_9FLAO|nr:DUF6089 family protein [Confluentibacter flavum]PKQ43741.1 hypothetical protein CSW08_17250 [Confluentibacter flavum]
MRYITIIIISILTIQYSHSQINELGVYVGGSNFIGDIGATNYISPNQLAFGAVYRWNRSSRHSYRATLIFTDLEGDDLKSDDPRRTQRGDDFTNKIIEASVGMELTFFDFDLHSGEKLSTPYLYSGITVANYDDYYFQNGVQTSENGSSWAFGIPMAIGFKTTFIDNFVLSVEVGARYTFTDAIDGNLPNNPNHLANRFGNINNNDWYVFSGIILTYTFGQNPCYCVN